MSNNTDEKLVALIIEDDYLYSIEVKMLVEEIGLRPIVVSENFASVPNILKSESIDIVLSDVKLSSGHYSFQILSQIEDLPPLIFYSSYDQDELYRASMELNPYIYIKKPLDKVTLQSAIEGALKRGVSKPSKFADIGRKGENILIRSRGKILSVDPADILYVHSEGNYCYLISSEKKIVIRSSLKNVISLLQSSNFMQVHRSFVVNIKAINSYVLSKNVLVIRNDEIPIGRKYKKELRELLLGRV